MREPQPEVIRDRIERKIMDDINVEIQSFFENMGEIMYISDPNTYDLVYLNRAEVYRAQGQPEAALADIRRATEAKDDTLAAWKMAGDIEDELGDKQAALEDYRRYVKLAPEATDIGDEYLKELSPKVWEKVEKARREAEEETIKAVKEKTAEKEKEKSSAAGEAAGKGEDKSADAEKTA